MASFESWLETYSDMFEAPAGSAEPQCPNCGHRTLRLLFTVRSGAAAGFANLWCETCLEGIVISRAEIPAGAVIRDGDLPAEERVPRIPEYRLVV